MRTATLALMACLLGAAPVLAQDTLWVRRLDLGSDEAGLGIASRGNAIAVAGTAWPSSTLDWLVVRLNQSGNIIWTRTYDSGADEYAYDVFIDSESDVLVTGFAQSSAVARRPGQLRPRDFGQIWRTLTSDQEIYALTAKYDSAGDLKWLRTDANHLGLA